METGLAGGFGPLVDGLADVGPVVPVGRKEQVVLGEAAVVRAHVLACDPQQLSSDFDPIGRAGQIEPVERNGVVVVRRTPPRRPGHDIAVPLRHPRPQRPVVVLGGGGEEVPTGGTVGRPLERQEAVEVGARQRANGDV
jgi:hypothetical protein